MAAHSGLSRGLYQIDVVAPNGLLNGDALLLATYNGSTTQPGVLLAIH